MRDGGAPTGANGGSRESCSKEAATRELYTARVGCLTPFPKNAAEEFRDGVGAIKPETTSHFGTKVVTNPVIESDVKPMAWRASLCMTTSLRGSSTETEKIVQRSSSLSTVMVPFSGRVLNVNSPLSAKCFSKKAWYGARALPLLRASGVDGSLMMML
jgi:hypothetical protein